MQNIKIASPLYIVREDCARDLGGVQTNLCVIGRDDLENAMAHPEDYQNLLVRIGGFSARFVTLSPIVQREIIERTTYGA